MKVSLLTMMTFLKQAGFNAFFIDALMDIICRHLFNISGTQDLQRRCFVGFDCEKVLSLYLQTHTHIDHQPLVDWLLYKYLEAIECRTIIFFLYLEAFRTQLNANYHAFFVGKIKQTCKDCKTSLICTYF